MRIAQNGWHDVVYHVCGTLPVAVETKHNKVENVPVEGQIPNETSVANAIPFGVV